MIIMKITATTSMTTDVTTAATTNAVITAMIGVMIDVTRTTATATTTTTARNVLHRHHIKGATLMVRFRQLIERSTSSSVVAKRPKATGMKDRLGDRREGGVNGS
jgi:hypothetical protein